jgi:hypothetical protein
MTASTNVQNAVQTDIQECENMADEIEINKVRIADVQQNDELTEAEQEKVTGGGGGYGPCPACGAQPCGCGS